MRTLQQYFIQQDNEFTFEQLFDCDVALGLVKGIKKVRVFGINPDLDSATINEDIWEGDGLYTGLPTLAGKISVASSSGNDTAVGTGGRVVRLYGLDENWEEIEEDVTLNGTTPVLTIKNFLRCAKANVISAGSSKTNAGIITATQSGDTSIVFFKMQPGNSTTYNAVYSVPAGKKALLTNWYWYINKGISGPGDREADVAFKVINNQLGVIYKLRPTAVMNVSSREYDFTRNPFELPEMSDNILVCKGVSVINTEISAGFDVTLIDKSLLEL